MLTVLPMILSKLNLRDRGRASLVRTLRERQSAQLLSLLRRCAAHGVLLRRTALCGVIWTCGPTV